MSTSSQRMRKSSPCSGSTKQGPMRATLPVSSLLRQSRQQPSSNSSNNSNSGSNSTNLRKSNSSSPTVSPTNAGGSAWRSRISPETSSSGQRSPGSLSYKGKFNIIIVCLCVCSLFSFSHLFSSYFHSCAGYFAAKSKTLSARCSDSFSDNQNIRRTASLDTIYLKGQWPRDSRYMHTSLLVDKATQVLHSFTSIYFDVNYLKVPHIQLFICIFQTEDWSNEPRKPHNRHPEQTMAEVEKFFRHRYCVSHSLNLFLFFFIL